VGVGVRYAQSSIDGNAASVAGGPSNSHTNINSYQITAYAGYAPGPFYINGAATYGLDKYSGSRLVEFPGIDSVLASTYSGDQATAYGTAGYHFYPGDGRTVLTPYASLQYTDLHVGAYTEGGNPALALAVNAQHYDFVESGLGGKIARYVVLSGSTVLLPEFHAQWLHSLSGGAMTNIAAFTAGGPSFTTVGLKPDPNTYNLGAGLTFANNRQWSIEAAYDYLWRSQNYSAQQLSIRFVLRM
jgi:outer membrane autotransporter protein